MTKQTRYLSRRSNGFFYVGYFLNGKLHWKTTKQTTKPEAREFMKSFTPVENEEKKVTLFSELFELYKNEHGSYLRPRTLNINSAAVNAFKSILGDKPFSQYTLSDVERFKRGMLDRKLAPVTTNMYWRSIKTVFSFAVKNDLLEKSPFRNSHQIRLPERRPVFMSKQELAAFYEKVDNPTLRDLYETAALTGLRLGEAVGLSWEQIQFDRRSIEVVNTDVFQTKSGRARSVPMNDRVYEILKRRSEKRGRAVFCKENNGFPYSPSFVTHQFKEYAKASNLSEKFHFHCLRHSCASLLCQAGVSIYAVKEILGHASVVTTQCYSHLSANNLLEAVNRI